VEHVATMRLVWLLAALTSRADGGCNFAHPYGWTCDSLWGTLQLSCAEGGRRLSSDEPYAPPRRGQQNLSRGGAQPTGGYTSRRRLDNVRYLGMA
jgi:hypothetical protein